MPFVCLNRETDSGLGDAAVVDNTTGGRMVADYLVDLGHRRLAGVFGPENTSTGRDRELGFRLALADAGIGIAPECSMHGPFEFDMGYEGMLRLLELPERPSAVFCGNDVVAIGALNAAMSAGVNVPADISVVGFDDIPMAGWEAFRLTTVGNDLTEMSVKAAQLLVRRLADRRGGHDDGGQRRVVLEPVLVERTTASAPPAH